MTKITVRVEPPQSPEFQQANYEASIEIPGSLLVLGSSFPTLVRGIVETLMKGLHNGWEPPVMISVEKE